MRGSAHANGASDSLPAGACQPRMTQ
jgi:hypothetical protein